VWGASRAGVQITWGPTIIYVLLLDARRARDALKLHKQSCANPYGNLKAVKLSLICHSMPPSLADVVSPLFKLIPLSRFGISRPSTYQTSKVPFWLNRIAVLKGRDRIRDIAFKGKDYQIRELDD
jgi:hypothetical protein